MSPPAVGLPQHQTIPGLAARASLADSLTVYPIDIAFRWRRGRGALRHQLAFVRLTPLARTSTPIPFRAPPEIRPKFAAGGEKPKEEVSGVIGGLGASADVQQVRGGMPECRHPPLV